MAERLCVAMEYRFKREDVPGSGTWILAEAVPRAARHPSVCEPGITETIDNDGDNVVLTVAVPCDETGAPLESERDRYDEIAQEAFYRARPDAVLG